jgi:hypothetical protein
MGLGVSMQQRPVCLCYVSFYIIEYFAFAGKCIYASIHSGYPHPAKGDESLPRRLLVAADVQSKVNPKRNADETN